MIFDDYRWEETGFVMDQNDDNYAKSRRQPKKAIDTFINIFLIV